MHTLDQTRPLSDLTGEQLLLMAIAGNPGNRRRIHQELSLRALLAEGARRIRAAEIRPRLRLARSHAA
jgi:hypothetical protein